MLFIGRERLNTDELSLDCFLYEQRRRPRALVLPVVYCTCAPGGQRRWLCASTLCKRGLYTDGRIHWWRRMKLGWRVDVPNAGCQRLGAGAS